MGKRNRSRKGLFEPENGPLCHAVVQSPRNENEYNRCHGQVLEGSNWCRKHKRIREYVDQEKKYFFVLMKNLRPSQRKIVVGKVFLVKRDAEIWAQLNSVFMFQTNKPGQKVVSYTVERIAK